MNRLNITSNQGNLKKSMEKGNEANAFIRPHNWSDLVFPD